MSNRFWKLAWAYGMLPTVKGKIRVMGKGMEHPEAKLPEKIAQWGKHRAWDMLLGTQEPQPNPSVHLLSMVLWFHHNTPIYYGFPALYKNGLTNKTISSARL